MKAGLNLGIQGLRGIAILLVLLNHAGIPGFAGGYVGVDIFFVISGYLIGGLLWREGLRNGRIAIWQFYARRIRRLFPANAFLVVVAGLASLVLLAPAEWSEIFSAMRAAQLYVINLWFTSRGTDYFGGGSSAANPFLHLWSLAVEEQFYLVWPWLVVLCLKGGAEQFSRRLSWVTISLAAASLLACVVATWASQPLAFFNMPFRMWEFAAGIGLAVRPVGLTTKRRAFLGWLAVIGLVTVTLFMDERRQFPGLWAVLPVLCAQGLLITATSTENGLLQRALSWRPLVRLGDCSYSVYLWHWPVLIFAGVQWPRSNVGVVVVLLLVSVIAGSASWRWIEEPLRIRWLANWQPRRFVILSLALAAGLAVSASVPRNWPVDEAQRAIAHQRAQRPEAVNKDPHDTWMIVIKVASAGDLDALLDSSAYSDLTK